MLSHECHVLFSLVGQGGCDPVGSVGKVEDVRVAGGADVMECVLQCRRVVRRAVAAGPIHGLHVGPAREGSCELFVARAAGAAGAARRTRIEPLLRHRLLGGPRPAPEKFGHRTPPVFVVLDFNRGLLARRQRDRSRILCRRVIGPIIDEKRSVYPEANAVVGDGIERVGARCWRLYLAGSPGREGVRADEWVRRSRCPVEVQSRIGSGHYYVCQIQVVKDCAVRPVP